MVLKFEKFFIILIFFTETILFGLINNLFNTSSYASGQVLVLFLLWLYFILKRFYLKFNKYLLLWITFLLVFILIHLIISSIFTGCFSNKSFISYFLLLAVFFSALLIYNMLSKIENELIFKTTIFLFYLMVVIGYLAFYLQMQIKTSEDEKNMILFSEPSHFAIVLTPLLIFLSLKKVKFTNLNILMVIFLAILVKNLTLLVGAIMSTFIISFIYKKHVTGIILTTFILVLISFNMEYFYHRIILDTNNKISNLSALVFLSGWEEAYYNLAKTNFLGSGFNQMGFSPQTGIFRGQLEALGFADLNIYDGGTTGAKIVYEFGLIGIMFIIFYLYGFLKLVMLIKKEKIVDTKILFLASYYFSFFIELFVRGVGYFSPNIILTVTSFFFVTHTIINNRKVLFNEHRFQHT